MFFYLQCPTIDPGASGAPDEDQSSCSFRTAVEGASDDASGRPSVHPGASGAPDEDQSSCSFRTAVEGASDDASGSPSASEGAVLEGPARKAHTV